MKVKELDEVLRYETSSFTECNRLWKIIEHTYDEMKRMNLSLTPLILRLSPDIYEKTMERVFAYEEEFFRIRESFDAIFRPADTPLRGQGLALNKKFRLPKFSGDFKKFRGWWQLFDAHVHQKSYSPIEKFTLLKEALVGLPASEIAHLEFTAEQYPVAVQIIERRFGSPREAEREHVQEIQKLYRWRDLHRDDKLARFVSWLSQNVKALISLERNFESLSVTVTPGVLACLPSTMRGDFTRTNFESLQSTSGSSSELETLLEYLEKQVAIKRACRSTGSGMNPGPSPFRRDFSYTNQARLGSPRHASSGAPGGSSAFFAGNAHKEVDHSCVFCASSKHESKACKKNLTYEERKTLCEKGNACFKCLKKEPLC
ncbi:uncharacterized protein LOC108864052 [Galendromus occidentalis]|uniref:Uncharacterized protein LOC108864052 n=1 Tax=Galendromus occidentalis TaxID=34638 RepID=A0AAJ7L4U2_9ACAR|nr:uncharacterized protein LOC108864052 [Galendromus occidentalis]